VRAGYLLGIGSGFRFALHAISSRRPARQPD
jgi:hypothetical protein